MDTNKVSVKIYGQEYQIAGENSRDHILKVADYVDEKMHLLGRGSSARMQDLAVLTAINAADDYFSLQEEIADTRAESERLKNEAGRMNQLWEEAKQNYEKYREELEILRQKLEQAQTALAEKDRTISDLKGMAKGLENKLIEESSGREAAVDERVKELESACFDLEMENVKMKAELERLKKRI